MCDYSERLMAWLDRELDEAETAELERHIVVCSECRGRIESYKQVSATLDSYYDAVLLAKTRQKTLPRWVPALTTAATLAIAATLVFALLRPRVEPPGTPHSPHSTPSTAGRASGQCGPGPVRRRERSLSRHVERP